MVSRLLRRPRVLVVAAALLAGLAVQVARRRTPTVGDMVRRPPMYVVVSFDGGKSLEMWRESLTWFEHLRSLGVAVDATYFVSGVYFLPSNEAHSYRAPRHDSGESDIGFGGDIAEIAARATLVNQAVAAGHEIGGHANGHYLGHGWTFAEWQSELNQFDAILFGPATQLAMPRGQLVGFRAPGLAGNVHLLRALRDRGYLYDASRVARPGQWPTRREGVWQFGISRAALLGAAESLPAMDYSFYNRDSGGVDDIAAAPEYEERMLQAYLGLFNGSYYGGRAPVQVLQHFELYNGGAYWRALRRFVEATCGRPEVECVTYRSLIEKLNALSKRDLAAMVAGRFGKLPET